MSGRAQAVQGLVSVIVPCLSPAHVIRQCVTALVRHTRRPWELIAISDAAHEATAAYLAGIRDVAPFPVAIVSGAGRLDAGAARNHGLAVARGEFLVLLDDRTVVTHGWLDQLLALAGSDPLIGMTGPMSNAAPPPQSVPDVPYTDLEEMHGFAAGWRRERLGKWLRTERLAGSCLLIKRSAIEASGGPGDWVGPGSLDGNLAQRVLRAGFALTVAFDLFVHQGEIGPARGAQPRGTTENGTAKRGAGGKVFGVGLPRTGTTSLAMATLALGLKTSHACFDDALFDRGDAFFDTPVYVDYPLLDRRYPDSKFILTWREPGAWYASFARSLGGYFRRLREGRNLGPDNRLDRRCYAEVFGTGELLEDLLIARYHEHRRRVQAYFQDRPEDLLVLDLATVSDPWDAVCRFLRRPRPSSSFPPPQRAGDRFLEAGSA